MGSPQGVALAGVLADRPADRITFGWPRAPQLQRREPMHRIRRVTHHVLEKQHHQLPHTHGSSDGGTTAAAAAFTFPFPPADERGLSVRVTPDAASSTTVNTDGWGLMGRLPNMGRRVWKVELLGLPLPGGEEQEQEEGEGGMGPAQVVSWCCFVEQQLRIGSAAVLAGNVTGVGTWCVR
jgi:hypothetical protein